ncbi:MAG TPA: hypothetical protein PKC76_07790 [Saprospiraceae bacterium]|nr:hypothetical protein [Saprospiraceae bacterium]HMP24016.1 hypothetical protein [Saprospiraceae bacterium]
MLAVSWVYWLVFAFYGYLIVGFLVGLWLVFIGVHRFDRQMQSATWRTRLLLLPGAAALWVFLLYKWFKTPPHET